VLLLSADTLLPIQAVQRGEAVQMLGDKPQNSPPEWAKRKSWFHTIVLIKRLHETQP